METLGSLSERIEPVLCHIIIPLFLRVGTGAKGESMMCMGQCRWGVMGPHFVDAPQLRQKDMTYSLNLMLNAINPLVVKATLGPTTSLAAAIISRRKRIWNGPGDMQDPGGGGVIRGGFRGSHVISSLQPPRAVDKDQCRCKIVK